MCMSFKDYVTPKAKSQWWANTSFQRRGVGGGIMHWNATGPEVLHNSLMIPNVSAYVSKDIQVYKHVYRVRVFCPVLVCRMFCLVWLVFFLVILVAILLLLLLLFFSWLVFHLYLCVIAFSLVGLFFFLVVWQKTVVCLSGVWVSVNFLLLTIQYNT